MRSLHDIGAMQAQKNTFVTGNCTRISFALNSFILFNLKTLFNNEVRTVLRSRTVDENVPK